MDSNWNSSSRVKLATNIIVVLAIVLSRASGDALFADVQDETHNALFHECCKLASLTASNSTNINGQTIPPSCDPPAKLPAQAVADGQFKMICLSVYEVCCNEHLSKLACDLGTRTARETQIGLTLPRLPFLGRNFLRAVLPHCDRDRFNNTVREGSLESAEKCCLCQHARDHVAVQRNPYLKRVKAQQCKQMGCCEENDGGSLASNRDPRKVPEQAPGGTETAKKEDDLPMACEQNFEWDPVKQLCVRVLTKCPRGMKMNQATGACEPRAPLDYFCQLGFVYDESTEGCVDFDECANGGGRRLCEGEDQTCVNTVGSFECECVRGFSKTADGSCHDMDECKLGTHNCTVGQSCTNTIGAFRCTRKVPCGFGYTLNEATQECEDVDECKAYPDICGPEMTCKNVRGSHICTRAECPDNLRRDDRGLCTKCKRGFKRVDQPANLAASADKPAFLCVDVDECAENPGKCARNEICINSIGSFECKPKLECKKGTKLNFEGNACEDIDECLEGNFHCGSNEICVNAFASYQCIHSPCTREQIYNYAAQTCECSEGFKINGSSCEDINECEDSNRMRLCAAGLSCVNTVGSYECVSLSHCEPGFERPSFDVPCEDIDECRTGLANCSSAMTCVNLPGTYNCECPKGYLKVNSMECQDIDECALFRPGESCPDPRSTCVNSAGSYSCVCPNGFTYEGYPNNRCVDVDECKSRGTELCGAQHQCVNTEGNYICRCAPGFQHGDSARVCVDVDECAQAQHARNGTVEPCPDGLCVNTEGGYRCTCPPGFRLDENATCVDIQECREIIGICQSSNQNVVEQQCINLRGSYRCVEGHCPPYYEKVSLADGFRCLVKESFRCDPNSPDCMAKFPIQLDKVFLELSADMPIPQVLRRLAPVRYIGGSAMRADVRHHYSYHINSRKLVDVRGCFRLRMSHTDPGKIELLLVKRIEAPVDVQISLYIVEDENIVSDTRLHLFITEDAAQRARSLRQRRRARRLRWLH